MAVTLARSYLYAPGNRGRLLDKVFSTGADAVILDLEDAVPEAEKPAARRSIHERLEGLPEQGTTGEPAAWVRINGLDTGYWREDVEAVVGTGLTGLRVPKIESARSLGRLEQVIEAAEQRAGLPSGTVRVVGTIESAAGLMAVPGLAESSRLEQLAFGAADFLADIGADLAADGGAETEVEAWVRPQLVVASRAARLRPPIAPVWTRLGDAGGLKRSSQTYRRAGFFGRSCIHPEQLAIVHEVFTPSPEEVEVARRMVARYDEAVSHGQGALVVEGGFVDAAVVREARALIDLDETLKGVARRGD